MYETVSVVQGIEKPAHKKAPIIAILIILLPLVCLDLTDEMEKVSTGNPCKSMILSGSSDNSISSKGFQVCLDMQELPNFRKEGNEQKT